MAMVELTRRVMTYVVLRSDSSSGLRKPQRGVNTGSNPVSGLSSSIKSRSYRENLSNESGFTVFDFGYHLARQG